MSTVITPPLPSVPTTDQITKADQADPPEVSLMQLTAIDDAEALGLPIPCRAFDPEVFFAETPADVEYAKSLCGACPVKEACLAGALERREPWGVWGGELFVQGVVVARKRPRGRPRKTEAVA
ncbi:WhiB family transcriptional regulator [Kitasatospora indigofera]|uniref:Transcriptional regulator WhiB n=2 Tax=Kitasatospora TaxID=2063 RepID=A0A919KLH1_9ACTN|nr:transcriptional regulator WhiB [Kitasatospora herbaricolor]GHH62174.1 transcriptional regulator WhiB [Kitasatospora indigofera]